MTLDVERAMHELSCRCYDLEQENALLREKVVYLEGVLQVMGVLALAGEKVVPPKE